MHSLTIAVKDELVSAVSDLTSQRVAELSTILRFAGGLHVIGGNIAVEVELDHLETAKRVRLDIRDIFGMATDAAVMQPSGNRTYPLYVVRVRQGGETLARQTGLLDSKKRPVRGLPNKLTTSPMGDLAAIWRGAFLATGSISEPGRSAAIEIVAPTGEAAMAMVGIGARIGIASKAREVRMAHRIMVRDGEAISELLTTMGAPGAVAEWEKLRERREVRATANRLVNLMMPTCDALPKLRLLLAPESSEPWSFSAKTSRSTCSMREIFAWVSAMPASMSSDTMLIRP